MVSKMCYHILSLKPGNPILWLRRNRSHFKNFLTIVVMTDQYFTPSATWDTVLKKENFAGVVLSAGLEERRIFSVIPETQKMVTTIPALSTKQEVKVFHTSERWQTCLTHHTIQKQEKHKVIKGKRKDRSCFLKLADIFLLSSSKFLLVSTWMHFWPPLPNPFIGLKLSAISL